MTTRKNLATALGQAVAETVDSAEEIHKKLAGVPIDILESTRVIEEPLKEVRKIQNGVLTRVYQLARGINEEVTRAASELIDGGSGHTPKVAAKAKNAA